MWFSTIRYLFQIGLASLPSSAIVRERNLTGFGHFEFIWGNRAKDEIYNEIIDVMNHSK